MTAPRIDAHSSREKILEVAEALFARRGFAGVGLREVAVASGLGKSSLFHHFRSKAQLYAEVLGRALVRIEERLDAALRSSGGPAQRLDRWIDALVDALAGQPTSARLLLRSLVEEDDFRTDPEPESEAAERTLARIIGAVEALLREGVDSGAFRSVSVPDTLQTLFGATVYHFASGAIGEGILGASLFSAESVARRRHELKNLLHRGLAAAPV